MIRRDWPPQELNCESQGMVEEDGQCVMPEPEEPEISEEVPVPELAPAPEEFVPVPEESVPEPDFDQEAEEDNQQSFDQGSSDEESAPSDGGEGGDFSESEGE